jgi:glutathione S-transferase
VTGEDTIALTLVIGNKNYSSWSFRPWIALKTFDIAFEERLIPLYRPDSKEEILKVSPAGQVPVLLDGDMVVWESLAILQHLAERFPKVAVWPKEPTARAHAHAIAAEMHAGFAALRQHCPMNMRCDKKRELTHEAIADVRRIEAMWTDCRARFGSRGGFLFGDFCAADAMYAPVVSRFTSYHIGLGAAAEAYCGAVRALPAWVEWHSAGVNEPWVIEENEVG